MYRWPSSPKAITAKFISSRDDVADRNASLTWEQPKGRPVQKLDFGSKIVAKLGLARSIAGFQRLSFGLLGNGQQRSVLISLHYFSVFRSVSVVASAIDLSFFVAQIVGMCKHGKRMMAKE